MKIKFYLLFTFFTLLFLFYPGDTNYFKIFAYNRNFFAAVETHKSLLKNPLPILNSLSSPKVSAEAVNIVDLTSFTPLYEKNKNLKLYPASTTKILTALVAFDIYRPDEVITVKKILEDGQVMGLQTGEKITVENLLYGLLVHSGNDAAYALADKYGFAKFIDLMNKKAAYLKMTNSAFKNPAGLDENRQYTTAYDLSLAAREILKNHYLAKISSTKEIIISDVDFKIFHKLTNVNKLLGEIQGIGGLKTGYTEEAGENLVTFYKKDGHQFLIVILKSKDRFEDTKNIIKWINDNVSYLNYSAKYLSAKAAT